MTQESSSEGLISTLRGFKLQASDAKKIVDVANQVANTEPIDTAGIFEAMQRSASSLEASGNTYEQAVAMTTAANSVVQDSMKIGTGLKTISMRIRSSKTEIESAGLDTEGMATSTAKLRKEIKALNSHVDLVKYNGASNLSNWYCNKHNKNFQRCYRTLLQCISGCDLCYRENIRARDGMGNEEFLKRLHEKHPETDAMDEYINYTTPIDFYCNVHDCYFSSAPVDILDRVSCCPKSFVTYKEEVIILLIISEPIHHSFYFFNCMKSSYSCTTTFLIRHCNICYHIFFFIMHDIYINK